MVHKPNASETSIMFTKPNNCCCFFSLRTGTLILASLDVVGYFLYSVLFFIWAANEAIVPAISYVSGAICLISFLFNVWFLVGAVKKNSRVVSFFSIYILVSLAIITILSVINLARYIIFFKKECTPLISGIECENPSFAGPIVGVVIELCIIYLINLHFFFSVKGYANELKNMEKIGQNIDIVISDIPDHKSVQNMAKIIPDDEHQVYIVQK
ncbi:hypothetical protein DSO57_1003754 [Entomophthora muscae]|uniref:Uncharacterized protein n=1 Tax=Entomophthora muscae TaxID=34485 RepID=A0ACC2TJ84_9FUNG|nr:hypothetical protein DSO57_1003754 [Entomophthora muscae]